MVSRSEQDKIICFFALSQPDKQKECILGVYVRLSACVWLKAGKAINMNDDESTKKLAQ